MGPILWVHYTQRNPYNEGINEGITALYLTMT